MKILLIGLMLLSSLSAFAQDKPLAVQCEMSVPYKIVGREVIIDRKTNGLFISALGNVDEPGKIRQSASRVLNLDAQLDYTALGAKSKLRKVCVNAFKEEIKIYSMDIVENVWVDKYDERGYLISQGEASFLRDMITVNTSVLPKQIWPSSDRVSELEELCRQVSQNKIYTTCETQPHSK